MPGRSPRLHGGDFVVSSQGGVERSAPSRPHLAPARASRRSAGLDQNLSMAKRDPVERALTKLQALIRRPSSDDPGEVVLSGEVPEDLQSEDIKSIGLLADERAALEHVRSLLSADLRFEYSKTLSSSASPGASSA
jgi:hypothetical protein